MTATTPLIQRLARASSAVYLATEAAVADDISGLMREAHVELNRLAARERELAALADDLIALVKKLGGVPPKKKA